MGRPTLPSRHDERGATLALVLVVVVVVAIAGAAVLGEQGSGFPVLRTYSDRGADDAAADGALTGAVAVIRYNPAYGSAHPDDLAGAACTTPPADRSASTPADHDWSQSQQTPIYADGSTTVACIPTATSGGAAPGGAPRPLPNAILTLGGRNAGPGSDPGLDSATLDTNHSVPFCYDQGGVRFSECEAGLFVGTGVTGDGGLIVKPTTPSATAPVVRSNSNIQVVSGRTATVYGPVRARGTCAAGVRLAGAAGGSPTCGQYATPPDPDPQHDHELAGYTKPGSSLVDPPPGLAALARRDGDVAAMANNVAAHGCDYYHRLFVFRPGVYTDNADLNLLTGQCAGLYWFQPGAYSFDFDNEPADHAMWSAAPRAGSVVVGGTPTADWTLPPVDFGDPTPDTPPTTWNVHSGWHDVAATQTGKLMLPDNTVGAGNWGDDPDKVLTPIGDGIFSRAELYAGTVSPAASVSVNTFDTPVPADATVHDVRLVVAYTSSDASTFAGPGGAPRLVVNVGGGWGDCTIPLGAQTRLAVDSPQPPQVKDWTASNPYPLLPDGTWNAGIDVAQACTSGGYWAGFDPETSWTPSLVNALRVQLAVRRKPGVGASIEVDGMQAAVDYDGAPAPTYPQGCQRGRPGVTWILGGWSRIAWTGQDDYVDLCASTGTYDTHGFAIYGVPDWPTANRNGSWAATPPTVRDTGSSDGTDASLRVTTQSVSVPGGTAQWYPNGTDPAGAFQHADGDGVLMKVPANGTASVTVTLDPTHPLVPDHSYVDNVSVRVRYAEQAPDGAAGFSRVRVQVGTQGGPWKSDAALAGNPGLQPTALYPALAGPPGQPPTGALTTGWDTTSWSPSQDDWWNGKRSLTAAFQTDNTDSRYDGIAGTPITVSWTATNTPADRYVALDSVEVVATFRPQLTVRPLRGCLTTRVAENPSRYGYVGVDRDWGARTSGNPPQPISDDAYASVDQLDDTKACPLLDFENGVKFHVEGAVYAPTAALELLGNDNDAPFVSDGVVARQVTAYRWKHGGATPAFGGGGAAGATGDRVVFLRATRSDGRVIGEEKVELVDHDGGGAPSVGYQVQVLWYRRRGGT